MCARFGGGTCLEGVRTRSYLLPVREALLVVLPEVLAVHLGGRLGRVRRDTLGELLCARVCWRECVCVCVSEVFGYVC